MTPPRPAINLAEDRLAVQCSSNQRAAPPDGPIRLGI